MKKLIEVSNKGMWNGRMIKEYEEIVNGDEDMANVNGGVIVK